MQDIRHIGMKKCQFITIKVHSRRFSYKKWQNLYIFETGHEVVDFVLCVAVTYSFPRNNTP